MNQPNEGAVEVGVAVGIVDTGTGQEEDTILAEDITVEAEIEEAEANATLIEVTLHRDPGLVHQNDDDDITRLPIHIVRGRNHTQENDTEDGEVDLFLLPVLPRVIVADDTKDGRTSIGSGVAGVESGKSGERRRGRENTRR